KKPKGKKVSTHIAKYRYESLDESVATVDILGRVKAVSKGKTSILVYTQNGLCKKFNITVK
ncbi:MAG: Ig-like domain-containing protein, partial [Eubacterium sp.]|nr:Ig-like domain-containing protein [Eubacterium sp.]